LALLLVFALAQAALAEPPTLPNEDLVYAPDEPVMEELELLRAWSIQLRGVPPTVAEYEAVETGETSAEATLELWLDSPAFAEQSVRFHQNHFWPNITNVNLFNAAFSFRREGGIFLYWRRNTGTLYRGDFVPCLDQPAEFDGDAIVTWEQPDGTHREGYVLINPYWAPETTIKVCAFDAQDREHGLSGVFCGSRSAVLDGTCGCGPELRYCRYGNSSLGATRAMGNDLNLRVRAVIEADEPYTELFTSQRAFVNGPMVHYLRHQTGVFAGIRFAPPAMDVDALPELEFVDQDTWVEVTAPAYHAGILTSPAYLIRFQTDRARANRFFDSFLCQPFQAPDAGLPLGEETVPHPDLQQRDGCKYCHALLEPTTTH